MVAQSQSNIETYKHGVDGLVVVDKKDTTNYILINVYGCRPEIRDDIGWQILDAYKKNQLGTVKFQTKIGEVVGELFYTKTERSVIVSYVFTKVYMKSGTTLIYKPYRD